MKQAIQSILTSVPPIVLFMGALSATLCYAGLQLLAMLQAAA